MTAAGDFPPIVTTVVGSYPQPDWLVDPGQLRRWGVPRVRADAIWRSSGDERQAAIRRATLEAIADQEAAGVEIITDGEVGRESYFNHFATALGGVARGRVGAATNRVGSTSAVPLVEGPIERTEPIELEAARFLRANTDRFTKVTVPGPFTLSQMAQNEYYPDQRGLAMAYAAAVNAELADLEAAGIDVLQIDEPYLQANPAGAAEFAVDAIDAALDGLSARTTLHTCYGYAAYVSEKTSGYPFLAPLATCTADWVAIESAQPDLDPSIIGQLAPRKVVLGVIDLGSPAVESPDEVADRITRALDHIEPDHLSVSPDCGMKYLPRERALAKLEAMVAGALLVRDRL